MQRTVAADRPVNRLTLYFAYYAQACARSKRPAAIDVILKKRGDKGLVSGAQAGVQTCPHFCNLWRDNQ